MIATVISPNEDGLRESRDIFFGHLTRLWWPEDNQLGFPSPDRQLELFRRIWVKRGDEYRLNCSFEQFNSFLTECGQRPVSRSFYNYFFSDLAKGMKLGDFIKAVMLFLKVALWKYGNFSLALEELGRSENVSEDLKGVPLHGVDPIPEKVFTERTPFDFIQDLSPEERYSLRYITGSTTTKRKLVEKAKAIGKQNTREYFVLDYLDVYIATSMRKLEEFRFFVKLVKDVFKHPDLARLNLRYFDPTVAYCENRIAKGLLEALMLRRAKLTLYVAGERDTFGKDSECAATLTQGKPVIVYVEESNGERGKNLDERARIFKNIHPLGLQVCCQTGVANGVIVVRNAVDCRRILRGMLLHDIDLYLDKDSSGYLLRERTTQSTVRVAPSDSLLVRSYTNFYFRES